LRRRAFPRTRTGNSGARSPANRSQFCEALRKSIKNGSVDEEAIAEAVERKNMRFVAIKTEDQLDIQSIHRIRNRLISRRMAVINQSRAFLIERGTEFAQRPANLKAAMPDILENAAADLTPRCERWSTYCGMSGS
jgi:transposase